MSGAAILIAHPRLYWGETSVIWKPCAAGTTVTIESRPIGLGQKSAFSISLGVGSVNGLLYVFFGFQFESFWLPAARPPITAFRGSRIRQSFYAPFPHHDSHGPRSLACDWQQSFHSLSGGSSGDINSRRMVLAKWPLSCPHGRRRLMAYLSGFRRLMRTYDYRTGEPAALKETL